MDFISGYRQIPLTEKDREKTAFGLPWGELLEWNVMPFGATGSPPRYQRFMQLLLSGLSVHIAMVYIDDIIILGRDFNHMYLTLALFLSGLVGLV